MCISWIAVEKYGWLVDGTAQARIERFEAEQHSFGEYTTVSSFLHFVSNIYCMYSSNKKGSENNSYSAFS